MVVMVKDGVMVYMGRLMFKDKDYGIYGEVNV